MHDLSDRRSDGPASESLDDRLVGTPWGEEASAAAAAAAS